MESKNTFNYKMTLAYDGTHYCGWQIQPNGITIQEILQNAIKIILKEEVAIIGSGRTDAGVHAFGQTAHFKHTTEINLYRFQASLNGVLPYDIRVKQIEFVPLDFHAQYSAIGKTYQYHLYLDRVQMPFCRLYSWHVHEKINLELLKEGASLFLGTHDFTSFANEAHAGCAAHDPIRTLKRLDIIPEEGGVCLEVEADGFLYKMVRNIVGTLVEVSSGKRKPSDIPRIFADKDRRLAGFAAPPQGLFLMRVDYP